jgi:hypothetical protein
MASTLVRVTDFMPATPILSAEVDSEFNQLVNLLNGTSNNIKATLDVSDSGDPPLELNQLSTGPILELYQAGILKAHFRNDGALNTPAIRDANDNEQLIFTPTASAVNEFTMKNAATGNPPQLQATGGDTNIGITLVPKGSGVVKIQSGLPTANEDAANKLYVDGRKYSFSVGFSIVDPSTATLNSRLFGSLVIPSDGVTVITRLKIMFREGSHTAGSSVTINFDRSGVGDIGTLQFSDTNNTAGAVYTNDIGDITPSANEVFSVYISARSGTNSERNAMAIIEGYRTGFN